MKKPSYPNISEVQKLIGLFERRQALREQVKEKSAVAITMQSALRRVLCDFLCVPNQNSQPFAHYVALYQRGATRRRADRDISAAIAELEPLVKEIDDLNAQVKKDRGDVRGGANSICAQASIAMRAEYETLIAEISTVLALYCAGDAAAARALAEETPVASEHQRQWRRCHPSTYDDDNLVSPLRAVLEVSTANAAKK